MKQKINIFEELNKMKGLITAKPGIVISEQNQGSGAYALSQSKSSGTTGSWEEDEPTSTTAPRTTPSGYGGVAAAPVVANNSNVKVSTSQNKSANYATMVTNGSKTIQTSLGMSPTGQLTDDDLQKILSKLNGETPQGGNQTPQGLPTTADGQLDLQKILTSL